MQIGIPSRRFLIPARSGLLALGFAFAAACPSAWSQTSQYGLFTHTQDDLENFAEYIDLTGAGPVPYGEFTVPGTSTRSRAIPFGWVISAYGACYDIRFSAQSGLATPDWSLWYQNSLSNPNAWTLASDNVDGVLPHWRLWVQGGTSGNSMRFILKGAVDVSQPSSYQGAGWMYTRKLVGYSQSSCQSAGYSTASFVNGVWTKIR